MTDPTPEQRAAHEALDRMAERGFSIFRNGKIVSRRGHEMTEGDRSDFATVKAAFPYSKLL